MTMIKYLIMSVAAAAVIGNVSFAGQDPENNQPRKKQKTHEETPAIQSNSIVPTRSLQPSTLRCDYEENKKAAGPTIRKPARRPRKQGASARKQCKINPISLPVDMFLNVLSYLDSADKNNYFLTSQDSLIVGRPSVTRIAVPRDLELEGNAEVQEYLEMYLRNDDSGVFAPNYNVLELTVEGTGITDDFLAWAFRYFPNVKRLSVAESIYLTDACFEHIGKWALTHLNMSHIENITGSGFRLLNPSLKVFDVSGNRVTDESIVRLSHLRLTNLDMGGNPIRGSSVDLLRNSLRSLKFSNTEFMEDNVFRLSHLTYLQSIDFADNLGINGMQGFFLPRSIQFANYARTSISDQGYFSLFGILYSITGDVMGLAIANNLMELNFSDNNPPGFAAGVTMVLLPQLRRVDFGSSEVNPIVIQHLRQARPNLNITEDAANLEENLAEENEDSNS